MSTEQDLINKLLISKKIMEKHNEMGRGQIKESATYNIPDVEEFKPVSSNYNLPQEFLTESTPKTPQPVTQDKIINSKLPDEIKQLMIEHPINQPSNPLSGGNTISPELAEKAARLMNSKANGDLINETTPQRKQPQSTGYSISADDIKNIVRETVTEVLKENGLLTESSKKTDEVFKFRVGQHLFEGKLTKVRKII